MNSKAYIIINIALLACSACLSSNITPNSSPTQSQKLTLENSPDSFREIQLRWLNQSVCKNPCWEGIMPGITDKDDALSLLDSIENVSSVQLSPYISGGTGDVYWHWGDNPLNSGRLFYNTSDDKVYSIWPGIGAGLILADIIQQFGDPTHAWVREVMPIDTQSGETEKNYSIGIVWLDKGFSVSGSNSSHPGWIDADFQVGSIIFFVPTHEGYILAEGKAVEKLVLWHGYDTWDNYLVK